MIDIVELMPERPDTILNEGLDKLTVLEDREIYYYFRDSVFYKELDQFVSNKAKIKLVIYKNNVELYTYQSNLNARGKYLTSWKEFMKDKLVITRYKSNAVITGIESGSDTNGNWIDSLSIQLVRIDRKYAAVNFSKQVNNIGVGQMNVFGIGKLEVVNNTNR